MCFLNFADLGHSVSGEGEKGSHCGLNRGAFEPGVNGTFSRPPEAPRARREH